MAESMCYQMFGLALSLDEEGNKTEALKAYSNAVESVLKLEEGETKDRLKKLAMDALDRAEKLKLELHPEQNLPKPTEAGEGTFEEILWVLTF